MAKAKKLPSGSWRVNAYSHTDANGKIHRVSFTAPTKAEAEMRAAQFAMQKKRISRSDMTVAEALERYISAKEAVLSPSTIREYERMRRISYENIKNKRIRKLTSEDLQLFVSDLAQHKAPNTVRKAYSFLVTAISLYAPDTHFKVTLPSAPKQRPTSPSNEDIRELYNDADPILRLCIAFAMCGIRRGEMCAFTYEDISNGVIHINKDMIRDKNDKWIIKPRPKTEDSDRYVTLPPFVLDQIGQGTGRIISLYPNTISKKFISLRNKHGMTMRFHDIRHYFASTASVLGVPDIYTADFGGWGRNSPVMKSVYQNNIKSMSDYYAKKINDHLSDIVKGDA